MSKLKPWYHVVTPREDLRQNRPLDASEFAVHLDQVRDGRAAEDYLKPQRFFDRTFMTRSLLDLSSQVVRRLSGEKVQTNAVFNMATQFGGGKTHALTALYHLAKGGEAAKAWQGVDSVLSNAGMTTVPKADVAVFVGTEFDVIEGRGGHGEPVRRTPWGEIAWQLGGEKLFAAVAKHDDQKIAPGGDVIRQMLPDGPTLILIDELLNYISRGRKLDVRSGLYNFLQNLGEEARARDNLVLCVSIPASDLEMDPEDQRDYESFKKLLDRIGKAIMMSAETESAEIIRRRLFDWYGTSEEGRKAALEYADWATEHASELSGIDAASARNVFVASYPFHPAVLSVFERKWQSLRSFQRTRGVLRLLAIWVAYAYQKEHQRAGSKGDHLIGLGTAPIEDPTFRAAMFKQLGNDDLEGPVTTDVAGKSGAWAVRLDAAASTEIREYRLHQKVATTILFESNGGQDREKKLATVPEIKAAVGSPDLLLPNVDTVLEELARSCYYLSQDGNRYRFGTTPNLNKILTDRRAGVTQKAIDQRIRKEIETAFKPAPKEIDLDRSYWPTKTNDVPDRPELTLVVFGTEHFAGEKSTLKWMEQIVRECGSTSRTMKSALIFAVPDSAELITTAVRDVLAWEEIGDDADTKARLDDEQTKQLAKGAGRAQADVKESIWRSYRRIYLLDKDNRLEEKNLGQLTSSAAPSIVDAIVNQLDRDAVISPGVSARVLLKNWPPALDRWSTKAARNAFFSSPALDRLRKGDSLRRTIVDGVATKAIGYAIEQAGKLKLQHFGDSMAESDVEFADDVFLLKGEDAQKLLEPPRVAALKITPSSVSIGVGEKATFSAEGLDQYGQSITIDRVAWSATGGTIADSGSFAAGDEAGAFQVTASCDGGTSATASVRLTQESTLALRSGDGGTTQRMFSWSGTVPAQKWMNFYTKVVSRYAANPNLRLTVKVEVPLDGDATSREQETKAALRDLGLDDSHG